MVVLKASGLVQETDYESVLLLSMDDVSGSGLTQVKIKIFYDDKAGLKLAGITTHRSDAFYISYGAG